MAPHSSSRAWKIPWVEDLVGCSLWGREESDTTEGLHFHFSLSCIGEGNGNPLQCYCLENLRDGGAWWAAVVSQSRTWLKRLSSSSSSKAGDVGLIPGSGKSPEEENGNPLQYSCLKNPMDRGVWWATVHRAAKSQTLPKGLSMHAYLLWLEPILNKAQKMMHLNINSIHVAFFFIIFKNFNWKIIALQYCVAFSHISTWINHRYTYVLCPLKLPSTSYPILHLSVVTEHWI